MTSGNRRSISAFDSPYPEKEKDRDTRSPSLKGGLATPRTYAYPGSSTFNTGNAPGDSPSLSPYPGSNNSAAPGSAHHHQNFSFSGPSRQTPYLGTQNTPRITLRRLSYDRESSWTFSSWLRIGGRQLRWRRLVFVILAVTTGFWVVVYIGQYKHPLDGHYRLGSLSRSRTGKSESSARRCQWYPWLQDCNSRNAKGNRKAGSKSNRLDLLHFERRGGHLFYPGHLTTSSALFSNDDRAKLKGKNSLEEEEDDTVPVEEVIPSQPHPIHLLMSNAKRKWQLKVNSQSRTLREAVEAYEKRYKRRPPKGFADWYWFAKGKEYILMDEFDALNERVKPFLAIPSAVHRERAHRLQFDEEFWIQDKTFTIMLKEAGRIVRAYGPMKDKNERSEQMVKLLTGLAQYLPDMNITMTGHDVPWIVLSGEARQKLAAASDEGKFIDPALLEDSQDNWDYDGWAVVCPPNSPLRYTKRYDDRFAEQKKLGAELPLTKSSFIEDHTMSMDLCVHPERQLIHGFTAWAGPRPGLLYPLFSFTSTSMHSDFLIPPIDQYDRDSGVDPKWEDKPYNKAVWRGTTTGADLNLDYMRMWSQRPRLCRLPNQEGNIQLPLAPNDNYTSESSPGPVEKYDSSAKSLGSLFFDIKFLGAPQQCNDPDACQKFKDEFSWDDWMSPDEQNKYKYVLDVDGNGWSGRFHRLLSTNTLVLKSTIFPEWYSEHIQPWLHYVPVSTDYSDLWSIMAFFRGVDEEGRGNHDELAKAIALEGKLWAEQHWRFADMQVYFYRLLLEYARVLYRDENNPRSMDM